MWGKKRILFSAGRRRLEWSPHSSPGWYSPPPLLSWSPQITANNNVNSVKLILLRLRLSCTKMFLSPDGLIFLCSLTNKKLSKLITYAKIGGDFELVFLVLLFVWLLKEVVFFYQKVRSSWIFLLDLKVIQLFYNRALKLADVMGRPVVWNKKR